MVLSNASHACLNIAAEFVRQPLKQAYFNTVVYQIRRNGPGGRFEPTTSAMRKRLLQLVTIGSLIILNAELQNFKFDCKSYVNIRMTIPVWVVSSSLFCPAILSNAN
jgi:hypothetical protein